MKRLRNAWPAGNEAAMVKMFAESILELTDRYSFESYRHKTLSMCAKSLELKTALQDVRLKSISKSALEPMLEEFSSSIKSDLVVEKITQEKGVPLSVLCVSASDTLEKISASLGIFSKIVAPSYEKFAIRYLLEMCGSGKREKGKIHSCASLYVSHVVGEGRSRENIHITAKRVFSINDISEDPLQSAREFFSSMSKREKVFDILIPGSKKACEYLSDTIGAQSFSSAAELPAHFKWSIPEGMRNGSSNYVILSGFPGWDPFSMARTVKFFLSLLNSFLFVFPDGNKRHYPDKAFVHEKETGAVFKVHLSDFINEGRPIRDKGDHQELVDKMFKFTFSKRGERNRSFERKLSGALQAASAASRTSESDARLLSIWSAFEAILPAPMKDGEKSVRITHFAKYIAPLATTQYVYEIYKSFYNDLAKNYMADFHSFVDKFGEGETRFEKFISIFHAGGDVKKAFTSIFSDSELLLDRAAQLDQLATSPSLLRKKMREHERRVSWQLHRIYRRRNNIVHKATSNLSTPYLTENAFSYFKSLISTLVIAGERFQLFEINPLFDICIALRDEHLSKIDEFSEDQAKDAHLVAISGALA
ncbi:hypothetical protein [Leisingera sp. ANG-S5]|uniref:hypothetical protein n=1 Tax=Leisingera sp. ANG-S5 TaxID=1577901 RepID=UPI00126A48DE|nr:hypothetical protein [Leisingera sp. ANG-S5]